MMYKLFKVERPTREGDITLVYVVSLEIAVRSEIDSKEISDVLFRYKELQHCVEHG